MSGAIIDMFSEQIEFNFAVVDSEFFQHSTWHGIPVLTYDEYVDQIVVGEDQFVVGVGYGQSNKRRMEIFSKLVASGAIPLSLIHKSSFVASTATLESGILVFPLSCIENDVIIKKGTIVWSNTLIGHNSTVGEFCFLAGSVTLGGSANLMDFCVVGIGASIGNNVEIGPKVIIGGGSIVMKHVAESSVIVNPSSPTLGLPSEYFEKLGGFDHLKRIN